jgi:hypothetical protein
LQYSAYTLQISARNNGLPTVYIDLLSVSNPS